eukprot:COSAG05_NODE_8809_length_669_cov_2.347368_1_plen_32_part_01
MHGVVMTVHEQHASVYSCIFEFMRFLTFYWLQ